ncbi:type IV secretory system conjugative DNA transfer family protein [Armatimonas sp.]|uniref:type IV secretory system conjugative DNA transfer family protein n=1 Tax=Armatimonas sp. TaxID=1872638 RepID=UPI00374DE348
MIVNLLESAGRILHNTVVGQVEKRVKKRRAAKSASPPEKLGKAVVIGSTIPSARKPGASEPVEIYFKTRLRHCFITGQVGSGKTTLARTLMLDDLVRGNGIVNIDYRGESTDLLLQYLAERYTPEELKERLVLLDLRQRSTYGVEGEPVVVFNPLLEIGNDGYAATAFFLDVLRQVWGDGVLGVQLIDDLRHILLALTLSSSGSFTILDIERMLTEPEFRAMVLTGINDPIVLRFFERFDRVKDPDGRVLPVTNKLSPLIATHRRLRATLGGTEKIYSFREHFEKVKNPIVLVCLAADETAKSVAGVVGALFLSAAIKAVMRSDRAVGEEPTSGIHFLLDEAANYATAIEEPLGELIREGRKFGAFCTLITQTPSSLSSSLRSLMIDVVGTMCFFSQGPQQAENLAGWISSDDFPKVVVRTLLMQAKPGEALLLRQGHSPCRMQTFNTPYPKVTAEKVKALRRAALAHWGSASEGEAAKTVTEEDLPVAADPDSPAEAETSEAAPAKTKTQTNTTIVEVREAPEPTKPARRRKKT